ncbi:MAG: PIN domain-containing protein [Burkholderiaceae bacterium]
MSGVLVDTSVWVDHFRNRNVELEDLLCWDLALTHPMVIGEIACGYPLAPRGPTLRSLHLLSGTQHASLRETMDLVERESLYGIGCGLVDMTLLASTLITPGAKLWTLDKRLAELAERFGVMHRVAVH